MRTVALGGAVLLAISACGATNADPTPGPVPLETATLTPIEPLPVFPGEQWERRDAGDWADLDAALARDASSCVAVARDGVLVHEAYFNGGAPDRQVPVYSITKSLTALLVGMQVDDDQLELADAGATWVPQWSDGPAADVTVRDLLAMTSGRTWSEQTDRTLINGTADQTAYAIGLDQVVEPGERWVYDNAAPQVLEQVLGDVVSMARDRLFAPLQMAHTTWPTDRAGNATTYSGVTSTCRDLVRVGYLVLQGGRWADRRLVSADYIEQMTSASSELNAAYGLLWWTNDQGRVVEVRRQAGFAEDVPPYQGRLAPHVPDDASWAFGYGNQYIAVVPSQGVVAVRLGRRPADADRVTFDSFTAGVLAALE